MLSVYMLIFLSSILMQTLFRENAYETWLQGRKLQFIKLEQRYPSHALKRLIYDHLRVEKVTNDIKLGLLILKTRGDVCEY